MIFHFIPRADIYALDDGSSHANLLVRLHQKWQVTKDLLFAVLRAMHSHETAVIGARFGSLIILVESLQVMLFALNPGAVTMPWHSTYVSWIIEVAKVTRPGAYASSQAQYRQISPIAVFCAAAFAWIWLGLVVLAAYLLAKAREATRLGTGTQMSTHSASLKKTVLLSPVELFATSSWVIKVLRVINNAAVTVLFVPIVSVLILPLRCDNNLTGNDFYYQCGSTLHLIIEGIGVTSAIIFFALCVVYVMLQASAVAVFAQEKRLDESNVFGTDAAVAANELLSSQGKNGNNQQMNAHISAFSRPHSRVEIIWFISRVVLVLVFCLSSGDSKVTRWTLCAVYLVCCSVPLTAYVYYLPYFHWRVLQVRTAMLSACLWAGVALIITLLYNSSQQPTGSVLLLFGIPMVMAVSVFITDSRKQSILAMDGQTVLSLKDAYLIELKTRYMLGALNDGAAAASAAAAAVLKSAVIAPVSPRHGSVAPTIKGGAPPSRIARDFSLTVVPAISPALSAIPGAPIRLARDRSRRLQRNSVSAAKSDLSMEEGGVSSAALSVPSVPAVTTPLLDTVELLLQAACVQMPSSAFACLNLALFTLQHRRNHLWAGRLLLQAEIRSPAFDIHFLTFALQEAIEMRIARAKAEGLSTDNAATSLTLGSRGSKLHAVWFDEMLVPSTLSSAEVAGYLHYQAEAVEADRHVQDATRLQFRFWTEMLLPEPNVSNLTDIGAVRLISLYSHLAHSSSI